MMCRSVRVAGLAMIASLALVSSPLAQAPGAVVPSLDVHISAQPALVPIAGKTHLVYELHMTNMLTVSIALTRVQVLTADSSEVAIADYQSESLSRRLGRPGLPRGQQDPQIVGPGLRAVAYLWIEMPDASRPPLGVRHRLALNVLRPDGPVHTVVEGAASSLVTVPPVALDPPLRGGPWVAIYDPLLMGGHRTAIHAIGGRARIPRTQPGTAWRSIWVAGALLSTSTSSAAASR